MIQNHSNTFGTRPALRLTKNDVYIHVQVILIKNVIAKKRLLKSLLERFLSESYVETPKLLDNRTSIIEVGYLKNYRKSFCVRFDENRYIQGLHTTNFSPILDV